MACTGAVLCVEGRAYGEIKTSANAQIGTGIRPASNRDSHPGSGHLNLLVDEVRKGVAEAGGFGARYYCTDMCDGESPEAADGGPIALVEEGDLIEIDISERIWNIK